MTISTKNPFQSCRKQDHKTLHHDEPVNIWTINPSFSTNKYSYLYNRLGFFKYYQLILINLVYTLGDHFRFYIWILCYEIIQNSHCKPLRFFILLGEADFLKLVENQSEQFGRWFFSQSVVFFFVIVCKYFGILCRIEKIRLLFHNVHLIFNNKNALLYLVIYLH